MRRLHPPTHLLLAFCTTARHGSISRAAEALHLTQSAVSKQVQELERWVGAPLFERVRKRLVVTPAGQRYEQALRPLLAQIESATLEVMTSGDGGGALHLSSLPTFGAKWLIPRLPGFQREHPQIALHFVPYVQGYDFHRSDLDCSILFGDGHWPGATAEYITGREVVLIAPPAPRSRPLLRKPADVARFPLLHHTTVPQAWPRWCAAHGVQNINALAGPQLDQFHGVIRAVAAGMGLALVPKCLVRDDIATGMVSAPLDDGYQDEAGYWLCHPPGRAHAAPLARFREWLLREAAAG
ncbi:LysR substrate-binding domain-containing protein [Ramlibacter sp.]|uniref:LysR substrate-binding domain-containing protein n=1 Tax=Ramlibacter sp. TaxID=1917967 RepID=UPI0035AF60B2